MPRAVAPTQPASPWTSRAAKLAAVSFATGFSGAMMPGPLLVAVVQQTAVGGFRGVVGLVTGHALLEAILLLFLMLGLHAVLERPRVRGAIGLVGGAALVWMGWDMLSSVSRMSLELAVSSQGRLSWAKLLLWGAAVCAANPYFTGWWATVGAGQLAHMAPRTRREYLAFYLGHEASDYAWYVLVGLVVITGRNWLLTETVYRGLIAGCAVLMALLGLWFAAAGLCFVAGAPAVKGKRA